MNGYIAMGWFKTHRLASQIQEILYKKKYKSHLVRRSFPGTMWASITLASMYFLSITWEVLFSKDPDIVLSFKNFTDHGSAILGRNERCSRRCRRWPPLKVHIEWLWDCAVSTKHDGTLSFHQMDYIVEAFLFLVANPDCVVVDTS